MSIVINMVGGGGGKSPVTISGSTVQFTATESTPFVRTVVDVNPIQNLNGYDHPWAGGTTKNIFGGTYNVKWLLPTPLTVTNGTKMTFSSSVPISGNPRINVYTGEGGAVRYYNAGMNTTSNNRKVRSTTFAEDVTITGFMVDVAECTDIQIELGGSMTDYVPYSNICPISGWREGTLTHTGTDRTVSFIGKNLFVGSFQQGYWAFANGSFTSDNYWICTDKIPCKPDTVYVTSWGNGYTTRWQGFVWYDSDGNYISTTNSQSSATNGKTFTSPASAAYMVYNIAGTTSSTAITPSAITSFQIEYGSTATAYEAPVTVYGGYYTIEDDGSTTLTITDACIDSYNGETLPSTWISDRDAYAAGTTPTTGAQVVYKLSTPVDKTLSPFAPLFKTIVGTNTVSADTGDVAVTVIGEPINLTPLSLMKTILPDYVNNGTTEDISDEKAVSIILGGSE